MSITDTITKGISHMNWIDSLFWTVSALGLAVFIGGISGTVYGYDMTQVLFTLGTNIELTASLVVGSGASLAGYVYNVSKIQKYGLMPTNVEMLGLLGTVGVPFLAVISPDIYNFFSQSPTFQLLFTVIGVAGGALVAGERYYGR